MFRAESWLEGGFHEEDTLVRCRAGGEPCKLIALRKAAGRVIYENMEGVLKKERVVRRRFAYLRDRMWED